MSETAARRWAWSLIAVSLACIAGLQYGFIVKLDRWDAWPYAALSHGALLPAVAAASLAWWRKGSTGLRIVATLIATVLLLVWLHTWCPPIKTAAAWIAIHWYLWLGV